ncbi:MAG TPA: hypothetical protein VKB62_03070 [Streptosporangiaceae bacterium]|nr:hypothetical protein [Streptosporangiaceae bacterium]
MAPGGPYGTSKAEAASMIIAADKGVIGAVCLRVFHAAEALGVGKAALRRAVG